MRLMRLRRCWGLERRRGRWSGGARGVVEGRWSWWCWRWTSGAGVVRCAWGCSARRASGRCCYDRIPSLDGEVAWEAGRRSRSEHHVGELVG